MKPISQARTFNTGFTLIEILMVLAILAAVMAALLPRAFRNQENNIREVTRSFVVLGKEIRNRARVSQSTMRLMIDLNPAEPKYWIEKASGPVLVKNTLESQQNSNSETEDSENQESNSSEAQAQKVWEKDSVLLKKEKSLPSGMRFASVETDSMQAPQTDGIAAVYFFPQGLMQATSIQITDGKNLIWSLLFNPLTGQVQIVESAKSIKDSNK